MNNLRYRNELKHVLTTADALVIKSRLSHILRTDQNAGPDGRYHIRSLYFDTPEDRALFEKMEGLPIKEKFRIRLYNHDHGFIRLEKKIKLYSQAAKLGASLKKEEVKEILNGNIDFLKQSDQALLREFYLRLRTDRLVPKTVVDYMREAYSYPVGNVRVTIDSDVRASVSSVDPFDVDLPSAAALDPGICILEVKFDGFLPEFIQDVIQLNKCTSTVFSKYSACRLYNTPIRGVI